MEDKKNRQATVSEELTFQKKVKMVAEVGDRQRGTKVYRDECQQAGCRQIYLVAGINYE